MAGQHYPVLWIGRTAVITLPVEIDITNADQVREDLLSVVNQGAALLVADLSKTTFCDSSGISALARTFRRGPISLPSTTWRGKPRHRRPPEFQ